MRLFERGAQLVGACMAMAAMISLDNQLRFVRTAWETGGRVVENRYRENNDRDGYVYYPVVEYRKADGGTAVFSSGVGTSPPAFHPGDSVRVLVAASGPKREIKTFGHLWFPPLILGIFALVFGAIGVAIPIVRMRRRALDEYLKAAGEVFETGDFEVRMNPDVSMNGRHPFRIRAKIKISGVPQTFDSRDIWEDPEERLRGRKIKVYRDRRDPGKYLVDIAFLERGGGGSG